MTDYVACEGLGLGLEWGPARMALNFECRVQTLDAKYWLAGIKLLDDVTIDQLR